MAEKPYRQQVADVAEKIDATRADVAEIKRELLGSPGERHKGLVGRLERVERILSIFIWFGSITGIAAIGAAFKKWLG